MQCIQMYNERKVSLLKGKTLSKSLKTPLQKIRLEWKFLIAFLCKSENIYHGKIETVFPYGVPGK